jgi:hypothetical protein
MFEHTATFVPVQYREGKTEGLIFKRPGLPANPDPASLWSHPDFEGHFQQMGQQGWELVSVQPLLQGQYRSSASLNTSRGLGFSITAGYYFFWKRSA